MVKNNNNKFKKRSINNLKKRKEENYGIESKSSREED